MPFTLEQFLFWGLGILAVFSAVMMITRRSPINSALFLILNFFTTSGIYLLLRAQFIAIIQVLVYMGAIMVLFLFVIMLLNMEDEKKDVRSARLKKADRFASISIINVLVGIYSVCRILRKI